MPRRDAAVENSDNIGMIEPPQNVHLALEARPVARAGERPFTHHLDGYGPAGRALHRAIDHALPAAVDLGPDLITRQQSLAQTFESHLAARPAQRLRVRH